MPHNQLHINGQSSSTIASKRRDTGAPRLPPGARLPRRRYSDRSVLENFHAAELIRRGWGTSGGLFRIGECSGSGAVHQRIL